MDDDIRRQVNRLCFELGSGGEPRCMEATAKLIRSLVQQARDEACPFCGRCPRCGYDKEAKSLHLDHYLCPADPAYEPKK